MRCPHCSDAVEAGDRFCSGCGGPLRVGAPAAQTTLTGLPPSTLPQRAITVLGYALLSVAAALISYRVLLQVFGLPTVRKPPVALGAPRLLGAATAQPADSGAVGVDAGAPRDDRHARASRAHRQPRRRPSSRRPTEPRSAAQHTGGAHREGPSHQRRDRHDGAKPAASRTAPAASRGSSSKPDAGAERAERKKRPSKPPVISRIERRRAQINAESVKMVVRHYLPQVRACYDRAAKHDSSLGGMVEVRFVIDAAGAVEKADVHRNSTGNAGLGVCIVHVLERWRFPRPVGGKVEFVYPFLFSSSS